MLSFMAFAQSVDVNLGTDCMAWRTGVSLVLPSFHPEPAPALLLGYQTLRLSGALAAGSSLSTVNLILLQPVSSVVFYGSFWLI